MPPPEWPAEIPIDEETREFLSPDTSTTTRADFTDFFQRFRHSATAHPAYTHLFEGNQQLAKLLIEHPAMQRNITQTFNTPANSKNKVYFMWDYVLRTFQIMVARCNPQQPFLSAEWTDILGRVDQSVHLILNESQLDAMNASVGYRDDAGVSFTDEIKELAKKLGDIPPYCGNCGKVSWTEGTKLSVCARCKHEKYCSPDCQRAQWRNHKQVCKKIRPWA